ncbi:MAG TPA: DinB family protein [Dehalococcoidia bacterium]|nr:DinB family protein [Dehalococcoidia bacterium]
MKREEVIEAYRASRRALLEAIEGLTEAEASEPAIEGWSLKDHLAHIAQWDELRFFELNRISAGQQPGYSALTPELVNKFNDFSSAQRRGWSLAQVLWELESTRARLLETIANLSERGLDAEAYKGVGLVSRHESEHAEAIKAWRAGRP